jgi:hypothetical protein
LGPLNNITINNDKIFEKIKYKDIFLFKNILKNFDNLEILNKVIKKILYKKIKN